MSRAYEYLYAPAKRDVGTRVSAPRSPRSEDMRTGDVLLQGSMVEGIFHYSLIGMRYCLRQFVILYTLHVLIFLCLT